MAKYNEILVGRYNRFIQKLFSMKGPATIPQVSGDIQSVFPFFNGRENRYLEGWGTYGFIRASVATAAITSVVRVRNPVGSNVIAVFERILFATTLAAQPVLRHQATAADLPTFFVIGNKRFDSRSSPDSVMVLSENSGAGGALLQAKMLGAAAANGIFDFIITDIGEIPLLPGDALEVDGNVVNQAVAGMSFLWRERFLEDSERT